MLTAGSTVVGLVPLAVAMNVNFGTLFSELNPHLFFGGDTADFWGPLSWTIIFGLSFATIVTLVVVPVMFYMMHTTLLVQGRKFRSLKAKLGKLFSN
jgi:multidrug efflux pump subunit AcrB